MNRRKNALFRSDRGSVGGEIDLRRLPASARQLHDRIDAGFLQCSGASRRPLSIVCGRWASELTSTGMRNSRSSRKCDLFGKIRRRHGIFRVDFHHCAVPRDRFEIFPDFLPVPWLFRNVGLASGGIVDDLVGMSHEVESSGRDHPHQFVEIVRNQALRRSSPK